MCERVFQPGEMSSSQRKAIITLIEKQQKDRTLIENWRPISLINVDVKIISKVIALRLKKVLVLVLSFKTSKLNQTVFNQRKLKSTYKNVPETFFSQSAILCQRY